MRRTGLGVSISSAKLSTAMLDVLLQLPAGSMNLKESVVRHLGLLGQMTPVRVITPGQLMADWELVVAGDQPFRIAPLR